MDFTARVRSLEQQSRELSTTYEGLLHRIRRLREETEGLERLRAAVKASKVAIAEREAHLARIKKALPRVARKEELERFSQRLDSMPFERFVRSPHVAELPGEADGTPRS
jgi:Zn-finger domain-containing protein